MSSRKVCTSVLVLGLSLGALSELHALPPQGARESRMEQALSNRMFQDLIDFFYDLVEHPRTHKPMNETKAPEGPGLCPNGKPPGHQGVNGTGNGNGNGNGNG